MTRLIIALAALGTTATSLAAVHSATATRVPTAAVRTISADANGKPFLLKRMVVTAPALPADGQADSDQP